MSALIMKLKVEGFFLIDLLAVAFTHRMSVAKFENQFGTEVVQAKRAQNFTHTGCVGKNFETYRRIGPHYGRVSEHDVSLGNKSKLKFAAHLWCKVKNTKSSFINI